MPSLHMPALGEHLRENCEVVMHAVVQHVWHARHVPDLLD